MRCGGSFGVTPILVGLNRVGIVGLGDALKQVDAAGLSEREAIVDRLIETLSADNYLPETQREAVRVALWREYLRLKGGDLRPFYSEIDVTVHSEPGEERDRFVETMESVLGDFELKPVVRFAPKKAKEPSPQLVIGEETILRGTPPSRRGFERAVRKSISDW